ncbi:hypothetical protein Tco_1184041 [Tanacetum coccineum]
MLDLTCSLFNVVISSCNVIVIYLCESTGTKRKQEMVNGTEAFDLRRSSAVAAFLEAAEPWHGLSDRLFKATNLFSIINKENEPPWEKVDDVGERENERSCLKVSKDKIKAAHVLAKLGMLRRSNLDYGVT